MFIFIIWFCFISHVLTYRHEKPLAEKLWSESCMRNSIVLNDCNWCHCDPNQRYKCKARVCEEIDMFGHFKDAIRDIDVGMEGRGSWRTTRSSCTPGVHYQRGGVLCVCDENGNWPNAVCRDLFRVLHPVEVTGLVKFTESYKCEPTKLYLVGCNVCFCPSTAVLDPALCTNKECDEKDPVFEVKKGPALVTQTPSLKNDRNPLEIYASCISNHKYKLGCMECDCLTNNRLLCSNCSDAQLPYNYFRNIQSNKPIGRKREKDKDKKAIRKSQSLCDDQPSNNIFFVSCNSCYCDSKKNLYCTSRKCITIKSTVKERFTVPSTKLKRVKPQAHDVNCIPGTRFKKDCNNCFCVKNTLGKKLIDCTLSQCRKPKTKVLHDLQKLECVEGSVYELDCMLCFCYIEHDIKHQMCEINKHCVNSAERAELQLKGVELKSVDSLHGYCEPLHRYKKNCNTCRCLTDGKTLMCSSAVCAKRSSSISVDLVPVNMRTNDVCPKGYSYKLDCNVCFCLTNGNAICTTAKCPNK